MQKRTATLPKCDLYLTQSLLGSWLYYKNADDAFADSAYQSFMADLRREPKAPTKAMQDGIDFEELVNAIVRGEDTVSADITQHKWYKPARKFARYCDGGQPQTPVGGVLEVDGLHIGVYGLCDYIKAGVIYDIKKVTRYEYGKYFSSPQHPMYLRLVPGAKKFVYLIFDGTATYTETYRPGDFPPIESTVFQFIQWLKDTKNFETYKQYWSMTEERKQKIYELQF